MVTITTARFEDLASILQIERAAHISPWSEGMLAASLNGKDYFWKAELNHEIIGYLVVMQVVQQLELLNIVVSPAHQAKGLGKKLMQHLTDFALANRIHSTFLEVRRSNQTAIALYQKLGFEQVGVRKNYYPDEKQPEDALVMQCLYG